MSPDFIHLVFRLWPSVLQSNGPVLRSLCSSNLPEYRTSYSPVIWYLDAHFIYIALNCISAHSSVLWVPMTCKKQELWSLKDCPRRNEPSSLRPSNELNRTKSNRTLNFQTMKNRTKIWREKIWTILRKVESHKKTNVFCVHFKL